MLINCDKGYVLVTSLLMLLVLTVIGISAIGTSTVENMLSGNIRLRELNKYSADAGAEISAAIIERVVREQDTKGFADIINDAGLTTELRSNSFDNDTEDVAFTTSHQNVSVDIDKMYAKWMGGTAIEFAAGVEGIGKSAGSGFYTFFRVNSLSTGQLNSEAEVGAIYRYVPK